MSDNWTMKSSMLLDWNLFIDWNQIVVFLQTWFSSKWRKQCKKLEICSADTKMFCFSSHSFLSRRDENLFFLLAHFSLIFWLMISVCLFQVIQQWRSCQNDLEIENSAWSLSKKVGCRFALISSHCSLDQSILMTLKQDSELQKRQNLCKTYVGGVLNCEV